MGYVGQIQNGQVVLDVAVPLPNGTRVIVQPLAYEESKGSDEDRPTLYQLFENVIGKVRDLPRDMADQHDHYLYGVPKK